VATPEASHGRTAGPGTLKEFFEERSAILEFDAGLARAEAEADAARITASDYPAPVAQRPTAAPVDALPWGVSQARRAQGQVRGAGPMACRPPS
jgi:hypothetical protein